MIQLARLTDYGIVLMAHLASAPERRFSSTELAQATHLPLPTVSKVLKQLGAASLLDSHRGAAGGYSLARPAREISVADVITALEGPIALTVCSEGPGECDLETHCQVATNWQTITAAVRGALEAIPLDEMARPLPPRTIARAAGTIGVELTLAPDENDTPSTRSPSS